MPDPRAALGVSEGLIRPSMNWQERVGGWFLVWSFKRHMKRAKRGSLNDAHEARHIVSMFAVSDTHHCDETCPLWNPDDPKVGLPRDR